MNKSELAQELNGRYVDDTLDNLVEMAADSGLVIVYGYCDDKIILSGAINHTANVWHRNTITVLFDEHGVLTNQCDEDDCPYYEAIAHTAPRVTGDFSYIPEVGVWPAWKICSSIPHERFSLLEEHDIIGDHEFTEGIVFSMDDLKNEAKKSSVAG